MCVFVCVRVCVCVCVWQLGQLVYAGHGGEETLHKKENMQPPDVPDVHVDGDMPGSDTLRERERARERERETDRRRGGRSEIETRDLYRACELYSRAVLPDVRSSWKSNVSRTRHPCPDFRPLSVKSMERIAPHGKGRQVYSPPVHPADKECLGAQAKCVALHILGRVPTCELGISIARRGATRQDGCTGEDCAGAERLGSCCQLID